MDTPVEIVPGLEELGILAFTTTREAGTFGLAGTDPVGEVLGRWVALTAEIGARGICVAPQVHGDTVLPHVTPWDGFLRTRPADGHATQERGIALAVTLADCAPVFIAHPSGAVAIAHSGWRGTEARIIHQVIRTLGLVGLPPDELLVHVGPAICGRCYEVSADVRARLTGETSNRPGNVDIRSLIAEHAAEAGVARISVSGSCTRCDNETFYSHRAGDTGRQIGVIVAKP
ncbi:MAG: polyphenol oxidase family protein [Gemmatimonadota bacterium]|nr:polyphenol oxidase family protein [Gemmatimonadota bacterium]